MGIFSRWADWYQGKPLGAGRSSKWPKVRQEHLQARSVCEACGRKTDLEVHHIAPFHLYPKLELEPTNLMTLCEGPTNCHFVLGHLGNWKLVNAFVVVDVARFRKRVEEARQSQLDWRS